MRCTETLDLYGRDDQCEHTTGHPGPHYTDAWGPRISWTDNGDVRSAA